MITIPKPHKEHVPVTDAQYAKQVEIFSKFAQIAWSDTPYGYLWYSGDAKTQKSTYWFDNRRSRKLYPKPNQNTYFGVHGSSELRQGRRALEASVKAVRCFYADFDAKLFEGDTLEEQLRNAYEHIQSLPIPFNLTVFTGGGYHVYTLLDGPFIIENDVDLERIKLFQKAFVHHIGADAAACDIARVLRYFPSWNMKDSYPKAPFVHAIGTPDFENLYSLADVLSIIKPTLDKLMGESEEQKAMTAKKREQALSGIKAEHPRIRAYIRTALESAIEDIAMTTKGGGSHGGRAQATYKKCISLMVRFGDFLTDQQVIDAMRDACTRNSYIHDDGEHEFMAQVTNGIKHGRARGADLTWLDDIKRSIESEALMSYVDDAPPQSDEDGLNFNEHFVPDELPMSQDLTPNYTTQDTTGVMRKMNADVQIQFMTSYDVLDELLHDLFNEPSGVRRVKFPFTPLNKFGGAMDWLEPNHVIAIASGAGAGKTSFGGQLGDKLNSMGMNLLWNGPEVKPKRMYARRLQRLGVTSQRELIDDDVWRTDEEIHRIPEPRGKRLDDEKRKNIQKALMGMRQWSGFTDYMVKGNYHEFHKIIEAWKYRIDDFRNGRVLVNGEYKPVEIHGVVMDYLQLMNTGQSHEEWDAKEKHILMPLRAFCDAYGLFAIVVSQGRKGVLKSMSSGSNMEGDDMQSITMQKFDAVVTLNMRLDTNKFRWPLADLVVSKNNDGSTGKVTIPVIPSRYTWIPQELKSYDLAEVNRAIEIVKNNPELYEEEYSQIEATFLHEWEQYGGKLF